MGFMKRCGDTCGIFGGKKCKERRECACNICGSLEGVDLSLAESCYKACNSVEDANRPTSKEDFFCRFIGGEELFTRYGITSCGYDYKKSPIYQIGEEKQGEIDKANEPLKKALYVIFVLIILATLYLFLSKKK